MGGRKIPRDLRLELYRRVLELHASGLSYRRIQKLVKEEYGVDLSRSNISYWVRGIHVPEREAYNRPDLSREDDVSWLAGVFAGDGSIDVRKKGKRLRLEVKDRELAEEASKVLARVMGRGRPYSIGRLSDGRYYLEVGSRELADHLLDRERVLEHLERSPLMFLRAFFDCEGSISAFVKAQGDFAAQVEITNTDLELLERILAKLEELGIRGELVLTRRRGKVLVSSRGRVRARRDCYSIFIRRVGDVVRFARIIGSSIPRKREKLEKASYVLERFGTGERAAVEWIRMYRYERGRGRERWFRREGVLSLEEARREYRDFLRMKSLPSAKSAPLTPAP